MFVCVRACVRAFVCVCVCWMCMCISFKLLFVCYTHCFTDGYSMVDDSCGDLSVINNSPTL